MGRRSLVIFVIIAVAAGIWWARRRPVHYADAYIADRSADLWSATAQVRRQVATLGYGEKVSILGRAGELTEVRAADGTQGWIDSRLLMAPALWNRVGQLLSDARNMPIQATGHTRTLSNIHISPGRDSARIFQFGHNISVAVLERQIAAAPVSGGDEARGGDDSEPAPGENPEKSEKSENEDWLLVLYSPAKPVLGSASAAAPSDAGPAVPIAGWVLSRFIELDPPPPIGEYTSAAGRRVVAWAQLDAVPEPSGPKPQYVVAATKGGEGQSCDFTSIRVYTWGAKRMQYETSFIDNNVCGRLPLRVTPTSFGPEFRFSDQKNEEHAYRLMQTVVRRIPPAASRISQN